jgi:serine/threonine protein kinase
MAIAAGTRLGRYEIRSPLGAGGMGEVYLAYDSQLERTVALKVLPHGIARDEQRMHRFRQEARSASALKHPSVAHIYEIGEGKGINFIAMEYR